MRKISEEISEFRSMLKTMKKDPDWIKNIANRIKFVGVCKIARRSLAVPTLDAQEDFASVFKVKHVGSYKMMVKIVKEHFGEEKE